MEIESILFPLILNRHLFISKTFIFTQIEHNLTKNFSTSIDQSLPLYISPFSVLLSPSDISLDNGPLISDTTYTGLPLIS